MPRQESFSYTVQARSEPRAALRWLADLSRQGELHPLIVRVREEVPPRAGALASWTVTDRLAWGPVRFPARYTVDTLAMSAQSLVMQARQWPATTVLNRTRIEAEPDGLIRIDVEITLSAPAPLFRYAFRQARAAHLVLAARLGPALSAGPADGQ